MNKLILILGLFVSLSVSAATPTTLNEEITQQGKESWMHKTLSTQQLATMVRNYGDATAAATLAYGDCGKTIYLNAAAEFATTLPSPIGGCSFKFVVKAAPVGTAYTIVSSTNIIDGTTVVNGGVIGCANENTITFTASAAISGDWVDLNSDGTNWYMTGQAFAATGIACTAP